MWANVLSWEPTSARDPGRWVWVTSGIEPGSLVFGLDALGGGDATTGSRPTVCHRPHSPQED